MWTKEETAAYNKAYRLRPENMAKEKARNKARYASDRETFIQRAAAWRQANQERARELNAARRAADPDRTKKAAAWRAANPESKRRSCAKWAAENRDNCRSRVMARRAARIQRTPPWYGELDDLVMLEAHDVARRRAEITGFGWDVDHVIPLQGDTVSGLHVWNNVAVIPASVNRSKGNRYEEVQ